jgi:hypothetical protein
MTGIANPHFNFGGLQIRRNTEIDEKITDKTENICLKRNFLYYCSVIQTPMHHEKASFTPYLCPHGIGYAGPKQ